MSITSQVVGLALDYIDQWRSGEDFNEERQFHWPSGWGEGHRTSFRDAVCDWRGWRYRDNPIGDDTSPFTERTVTSFVIMLLEAFEGGSDDSGGSYTPEQTERVLGLAERSAQSSHAADSDGSGGHDGFFDECDHADCRLFREV